jgi:predicted RNA-binding Zn-ribbon protein involved in translation (DUF1610 family)
MTFRSEWTHYAYERRQGQRTAQTPCGRYIEPRESSQAPTCPVCSAAVWQMEREDERTAAALSRKRR